MPAQVHPRRTESCQVPVQHSRDLAHVVEDEVAEAGRRPTGAPPVAPPAGRRGTTRAPRPGPAAARPRTTSPRTCSSGRPRAAEPDAGHNGAQSRRHPGHRVDRRQRVEQPVVHALLELGSGIDHVGVEHGRRPGDVAVDPGITREWASRSTVDRRRRAPATMAPPPRGGHRVLHRRLRAEVVPGEGRHQRRQPHDHAGLLRTEVDEHGLVRHAPLRVRQRRNPRRRAAGVPGAGHERGIGRDPAVQPLPQCSVVRRPPVAIYGR